MCSDTAAAENCPAEIGNDKSFPPGESDTPEAPSGGGVTIPEGESDRAGFGQGVTGVGCGEPFEFWPRSRGRHSCFQRRGCGRQRKLRNPQASLRPRGDTIPGRAAVSACHRSSRSSSSFSRRCTSELPQRVEWRSGAAVRCSALVGHMVSSQSLGLSEKPLRCRRSRSWRRCLLGTHRLLVDDLTDSYQVAIGVDDCELAKAPWFVFQKVHARDACAWQRTG